MAESGETRFWIILFGLLVYGVTDVNADETKTALIAAGCVAGGLVVAALTIGAVFCFLRHKRRVEKKPLPRYPEKPPATNGIYRSQLISGHPSASNGHLPDSRDEHRGLGPKAFTQHAASPRQRPPVPFYTMRADPRLLPELPGVVHMGPPTYPRPPQVGRPVFFLDRLGASKPKGSNADFMYPNSGTMLYYANGGATIQRENENKERTRRHSSRESSQRDSKSRSRSQSYSRSQRPHVLKRRHSDTSEISVLGIPGDVILREKHNFFRSFKHNRHDSNNNPFALYFMNKATDMPVSNLEGHSSRIMANGLLQKDHKYVSEGGRYSVTQLQTHSNVYPAHNSQVLYQESERTMIFEDESDDLSSTPRKDYPNNTPRTSGIFQFSDINIPEHRVSNTSLPRNTNGFEERPVTEYIHQYNGSNQSHAPFRIKNGEIDDIIAMSSESTNHTRSQNVNEKRDSRTFSYRQNPNVTRPPTPPSTKRPPTPPFDGTEVMIPSTLSVAQHHGDIKIPRKTSRSSTPSPDMSPDKESNPIINLDDIITALPPPPPPPPPLPGANVKYRSPTPPPGLMKHDNDQVLDNIQKDIKQSSSAHAENTTPKTPKDNLPREGGLPFIEELRRRQKSIDEGIPFSPPLSSVSASNPPPNFTSNNDHHRRGNGDNNSCGSSEESHRSNSPKHGLPNRPSIVQFADDPPEIIPHEDNYSFQRNDDNENPEDLGIGSSFAPPPPAPPPPPPPPLLSR